MSAEPPSTPGAGLFRRGSDAISPTAHYTGYVWYRHGLSHRGLATARGARLYQALRPLNAGSATMGGPTLEGLLLSRHKALDAQLDAAIRNGEVGQVIEVAAGLSPRGWDFCRRHPGLRYVEADLPAMAARKRRLLDGAGLRVPLHTVQAIDALADNGPESLAALASSLDPGLGLAIVTEGLLNYFDTAAVLGMWRRFATSLRRFPSGLYLSDLHIGADNRGLAFHAFSTLLAAFVRGRVHRHFDSAADAAAQLQACGFRSAALDPPPPQPVAGTASDLRSASLVRLVRAAT